MAITNEEFKERVENEVTNASNPTQGATDLLANISQSSFDDYDAASLDKIEELLAMSGNNLPKNKLDAINGKIAEQRNKLAQQTQEQPVQETPAAEETKPAEPTQEETPAQETSEFDSLTSYDLYMKRENLAREIEELSAQETPDLQEIGKRQEQIKAIEDYAAKELSQTTLDEDNAPMVKDYVEILTRGNDKYHYEHADELEQKLADYDKNNGLDGELPSAEQIKANEDKWAEMTSGAKYSIPTELGKDAGIQALVKEEPQTLKETLEVIRTMALTQLSLEAPDDDPKKTLERYHEKIEELSAQYLANVNTSLRNVLASDEEKDKWLKQYLADNKLTEEEWNNIQKDPELKKQHSAQFTKYVVSNIYKATNCAYTEKNAMYAARLARKTAMTQTPERAAEQKKEMTGKHPKAMAAVKEGVKNILWTAGMAAAFGPIGVTARQGWKLAGAFKKSWRNYKEQNDGKGSIGGFFKYLGKNREETINLIRQTALFATSAAFTAAMAASGTLAFGALGSVAGIGAQAATQAATQATVMGLAKYKITGAISVAAGLGQYFNVRHESAKARKGLTAILEKYLPEQETQKKGLLGKLFGKSPAQQAVSNLTGLIRNGDEKVMAKLAAMAPNMSAEDREAAMNYINQIKTGKGKSIAAGLGVVAGGVLMTDTAQEFIQDQTQNLKNMLGFGSNASSGNSGNGGKPWDPNKSFAENMEDRQWKPEDITKQPDIKVPYAPGMQPEELSEELHNLSLSSEDFEKITNGPNTIIALQNILEHPNDFKNLGIDVDKIREIGLDFKKLNLNFDEMRGNGSHVRMSAMVNHLNNLQLSDADQEKLHKIINTEEFGKIEKLLNDRDENGQRLFIQPGGRVTVSHQNISQDLSHSHTGNGGNGGNGNLNQQGGNGQTQKGFNMQEIKGLGKIMPDPDVKKPLELPETVQAVGRAKQSGIFSFLHKKQDYTVPIPRTGDLNSDVEHYAHQVALKQQLAKAGVADVNNPTPEQVAAAEQVLSQKGYHITGKITDGTGQEHSFKVVRSKDGSLKRIIDGQKMKVNSTNPEETQYATYKRVKLAKDAVIDPEAKAKAEANGGQYISEKADKLRGILKTKENGVNTQYSAVTDGDTGKDFIIKVQNGKSEIRQVSNASAVLKQLAKGAQQQSR